MDSRRRKMAVITTLGLVPWLPSAVPQRLYRVAVLINGSERNMGSRVDALRAGLTTHGYIEGKNLILIVRWNESGLVERLPDLAADLVRQRPDVAVAAPVLSAAAFQKHSRTLPIVMGWGAGAVKVGLAKSLARPGGNVSGLDSQNEDLTDKHIELLKDMAPGMTRLGILNTGKYLFHDEGWSSAVRAAKILKLRLVDLRVSQQEDLAPIAAMCSKGGCDGLYVMPDPVLTNWRMPILELAARLRLPAMYPQPDFVREGGLMSYAPNIEDMMRRAAVFVDKILKGAKPADLPIERPTRFELMVNLKTAKEIGLTIPQTILVSATHVIQ